MTKANEPDGAREINSSGFKTKIIPDFFEIYPEYDAIIQRDEVVVKSPNQRNSFRIGNNGILIPDENNSSNYKLVCYEGDSQNPVIKAVYMLENYDYNIHDGSLNIAQTIIDLWEAGLNEEYRKTILQNYSELSKTILKRYNSKSRKFVKLTRASVSTREDNRYESNRTGASENAG